MGIVFFLNSFMGELFWHFWIYEYDFQEIFRPYVYTFGKFLRICWRYFYDLNGTALYLGNSSNSPRRELHKRLPGIPPE